MDTSILPPDSRGRLVDSPPPQPPRSNKSLMAMASGDQTGPTPGIDTSNPGVRAMQIMGDIKNGFIELSTLLPVYAQGFQQIVSGLEQVVPQGVADLIAGNPPGTTGSGLGAGAQAPTAPPVQAPPGPAGGGMP